MSLADGLNELGKTAAQAGKFTSPDQAASMTLTSQHADVSTGPLDEPLVCVSDWHGVLRHFGLDPSEFEIVDDTVKMSRWQQSRRTESGDRDMVWLHAYSARFRRITDRLPEADFEAHRARVQKWKPKASKAPSGGSAVPCTFYIGWADWQLGKDKTEETTQAVMDSFEAAIARIKELRKIGRNITSISIWNMGDPNEGCEGNYASQLFTSSLTRREQLNLALDLWSVGLSELSLLAEDVEFGSTLCNHGEWSRSAGAGNKPVTSDSDNIGGYLGDTLRRVFDQREDFGHIRWSIPDSEMSMFTDMSGVPVALTHGHKAPSGTAKEIEYLRGQSIRLLREHGREPRLWMTAHKHHLNVCDFGPWTRIQMPALDAAGSKWFTDISGNWSTPGTLTCLVGEHEQAGGLLVDGGKGFSDLAVL